jgi:AcrR family transcriptional regulator
MSGSFSISKLVKVESSSETIRNDVPVSSVRPLRADARRNLDALVDAAKSVFSRSGVDAPAKEIADEAGVGVGTLYRHFPRRSDLVVAVFKHEVDACADAAGPLAEGNPPFEALALWLYRFTDFVSTKHGLAQALHSGDPAFDELPAYFRARFGPALSSLLDGASAAGTIDTDLTVDELLYAAARLCQPIGDAGDDQSRRLVGVLVNGLRAPKQ